MTDTRDDAGPVEARMASHGVVIDEYDFQPRDDAAVGES